MRPATARYLKRFIPTMVLYAIALVSVIEIFQHHHVAGVAAYVLALLPALPIVGIVVIVGLYLREENDEVEKAILTQAMLWGIGLTLSIATMWGFLEVFKLVPHVEGYLAFPLFCATAGISAGVIRRRYR